MPKFLIERDVPGLGNLSDRDYKAMSLKSNRVLHDLGSDIQWQHSYVTGDKLYCVYIASDEKLIREHGRLGEFPITNIMEVKTRMDPTTAEKQEEPTTA